MHDRLSDKANAGDKYSLNGRANNAILQIKASLGHISKNYNNRTSPITQPAQTENTLSAVCQISCTIWQYSRDILKFLQWVLSWGKNPNVKTMTPKTDHRHRHVRCCSFWNGSGTHAWQKSVSSTEKTVTQAITVVIAPSLVSRLRRNRWANFRWTSLDSPAREAPPPLHTFVHILNSKHKTIYRTISHR